MKRIWLTLLAVVVASIFVFLVYNDVFAEVRTIKIRIPACV
jgi:hypothetical protein